MMIEQIQQKMQSLRMEGMYLLWNSLREQHQLEHITADELLQMLLQAEWEYRQGRKQNRLISAARFRYQSSLDEIDWSANRNLSKSTVLQMLDCGFIKKAENVIITGPTGVGKSFVGSALGHHACQQGYKVAYFNMHKLFQKLRVNKVEGLYIKEMSRLAKQDLLILDDLV
jgi:DNA replication protein DnaC